MGLLARTGWPMLLAACGGISGFSAVGQIQPSVSYEGRAVRYALMEHPYYVRGCAMVSLRTTCLAMGIGARRRNDGVHWVLTRGSDRLEFCVGDAQYTFNGATGTAPIPAEERGTIVFVPTDILQPLSGGNLAVKAVLADDSVLGVFYDGRLLHTKGGEGAFRQDGIVYVPLEATAAAVGARVTHSKDGLRFTIVRSLDKILFERGTHWYVFNGAERSMRGGSVQRGKTVFVPIEVFQAMVGQELKVR